MLLNTKTVEQRGIAGHAEKTTQQEFQTLLKIQRKSSINKITAIKQSYCQPFQNGLNNGIFSVQVIKIKMQVLY
jgi:hypothetical protein